MHRRSIPLIVVGFVVGLMGLAWQPAQSVAAYSSSHAQVQQPNTPAPSLIFRYGEARVGRSNAYNCISVKPDGTDYSVLIEDWQSNNHLPECDGVLSPNDRYWLTAFTLTSAGATTNLELFDTYNGVSKTVMPSIPRPLFWDFNRWRIAWHPDSTGFFLWEAAVGERNQLLDTGKLLLVSIEPLSSTTIADLSDMEMEFVLDSTHDGHIGLAVSPDGKQILTRIGEPNNYGLYSIHADSSGEITPLVEKSNVGNCTRWSPDGSKIAFNYHSSAGFVATVNVGSANARTGPGTAYGVVSTFQRGTALEILESSSGWYKVTNPEGQEVWISDKVVSAPPFSSTFTVEVINADGSGQTTLGPGFEPAWSPDGSKIALIAHGERVSKDRALALINADGTGFQEIFSSNDSLGVPQWSPDGTKIAYMSSRTTINQQKSRHFNTLHTFDLIIGQDHVLREDEVAFGFGCGANATNIQWSSNSQWLTYLVLLPDPSYPSASLGDVYFVCNSLNCTNIQDLNSNLAGDIEILSLRWIN